MQQYLKLKSKIEYFSLTNYTIIPRKVKRVIFSLTRGFIGEYTFRYTDLKAEDILKKL